MQINSRKRWFPGVALTLALLVMTGGSSLYAQDVAVGQATATVLAVLQVTADHDLAFGDILQGVPADASKTVIAEAGVFTITGEAGSEVSLYLQLPDYLWNATNTDRLVISFSSTDADIDTSDGTPAAHGAGEIVNQDPHNLSDTPLGAAANNLKIFLGGTVFPTVDQRATAYTADIVLTAAYTGN